MRDPVLLVNIGTLLSGRIDDPIIDADAVLIEDGRITAIGASDTIGHGAPRIDVDGATVLPGLIDNHVHPVSGDYTPRQSQSDYLSGFVHGGVTSVVSAGEVHFPGRPKDREGSKALAVLSAKAFASFRPLGMRVHAGALLLEHDLVEEDFRFLADQGVHLVGEIGISGVQDVDTAQAMTRWAQAAGMTVMSHTGGKSVPTSRTIDGAFVVDVRPDVAGHVNGGPTSPSVDDVRAILAETDAMIELVHNGNVRAAREITILAAERGELHRVVVGTDSPAGTGVVPLGMLRTLAWMSALAGVPAAQAVAAATGNTARLRRIEGGVVEVGAVADLVIADAPEGSHAKDFSAALEAGDTPAIAGVLTEGALVVRRSRVTPPPMRRPSCWE